MDKRYVEVNGNYRERGVQIGKRLKDEILTNYLNQEKFYKSKEDFDYYQWGKMAERYIPMMKRWTPEVLEELYGMAEGAEIDFHKILALTTAYEKSFGRNQVSDKCTSFFLTGHATCSSKTLVGQTNDENLLEWRHELDVVIHHKAETGHEILTYTHPGIPAYMGINNTGLAVLWTYIDNGETTEGVPTNAIIRHLLEYDDIEKAVDFLQKVPHDIPNNFGLADKKGNLISAECFPNKVNITKEENSFVHTNHNVYSLEEAECTCSKTTWDRYDTIKELVSKNWGNIDVSMAKDFLCSHEKGAKSICVHPSSLQPWNKTLAAMVFELDNGTMNIAFGNPCEVPYRQYKFEQYKA